MTFTEGIIMNKIEILRNLSYLCATGLFIYAWQIDGIKLINRKKLILPVTFVIGFEESESREEK